MFPKDLTPNVHSNLIHNRGKTVNNSKVHHLVNGSQVVGYTQWDTSQQQEGINYPTTRDFRILGSVSEFLYIIQLELLHFLYLFSKESLAKSEYMLHSECGSWPQYWHYLNLGRNARMSALRWTSWIKTHILTRSSGVLLCIKMCPLDPLLHLI